MDPHERVCSLQIEALGIFVISLALILRLYEPHTPFVLLLPVAGHPAKRAVSCSGIVKSITCLIPYSLLQVIEYFVARNMVNRDGIIV